MSPEDNDRLGLEELNLNRRSTLGLLGAAGAGMFFSGGSASAQSSSGIDPVDPDDLWNTHLGDAASRREKVADKLIGSYKERRDTSFNEGNDDEIHTVDNNGNTYLPFAYQKALKFGSVNGIEKSTYEEFMKALDPEKDETHPGTDYPIGQDDRPLVSPLSSRSYATDGTDPWIGTMPAAYQANSHPNVASKEEYNTYLEMLETFLATYLRHVPFEDYDDPSSWSHPHSDIPAGFIQDLAKAFNKHDRKQLKGELSGLENWITEMGPGAFRDEFTGCRDGPYVSQHLQHEIPLIGSGVVAEPTVEYIEVGDSPNFPGGKLRSPFGTSESDFKTILRGSTPGAEPGHGAYDVSQKLPDFRPQRTGDRWPHNGHDLASLVRDDPAFGDYFNVALQLFSWGAEYAGDVPYSTDSTDVLSYIDAGAPALLDLLGRVCRNALLAAFHQKWYVHRRLRPETYAYRLVETYKGNTSLDNYFKFFDTAPYVMELNASDAPDDGLLPLAFPEGSPAHPAYPSGHSVIAGACATVLKAFFKDQTYDQLPDGDFPGARYTDDGSSFTYFDNSNKYDESDISVHGEINKFASNIGIGRIFAGVHYRTDHVYGMMLGEQIAVATLYHHFRSGSLNNSLGTNAIDPDNALKFTPLVPDIFDKSQPYVEDTADGIKVKVVPEAFEAIRESTGNRDGSLP